MFSGESVTFHPFRVRCGVGVLRRPPIALVVAGNRSGPHTGSSTGRVGLDFCLNHRRRVFEATQRWIVARRLPAG